MSGSTASLMSIGGLVSGLKVDDIIAKLTAAASAPITQMKQDQSQLLQVSTAWAQADTRLLAIKDQATALTNLAGATSVNATSSDSSLSVMATKSAVVGNYTIKVNAVSTYDQLTSSQTYGDENVALVGAGAFTLTQNGQTTSIDTTNLTLDGLRDAINKNATGVKAIVMSDGASTPSYRLVLSSQTLGSAGAITVGGTLDGWSSDNIQHLSVATDTSLTIGDATNGGVTFNVTRVGNSFSDVIPGVSMNVTSDAVGKTMAVRVTSSNDGVKSSINNFVSQYNAFLDFVDAQESFDAESGTTGALFGDYKLQQIESDLYSTVFNNLPNLPSNMSSITQLGISMDNTGRLQVDSTMLNDAVNNHLQDVINLFDASGLADDAEMSYVSSTSATKTTSTGGYAVNITQAATQAQMSFGGVGGTGLVANLLQDEKLTINGTTIALAQNDTPEAVLKKINDKAGLTGVIATLTDPNNNGEKHLTLTQMSFGADNHVEVSSDTDAIAGSTGIGFTLLSESSAGSGNSGIVGQDVAGTIGMVNGKPGAATGKGQLLTSSEGDASGLQIKVTGTQARSYGVMMVTNGIGSLLNSILGFITDPSNGTIKNTQDSLSQQLKDLDQHITDTQAQVDADMQRQRDEFNAMEVALTTLQNQSSQLASLLGTSTTSKSS